MRRDEALPGTPPAYQAVSERIAAYLRGAILSGEIGPGQRLRQEDIAARLGASRLPVREALRILEAEGLTEHAANKGSRVPLLDQHEVDVLYQMRERLEPLALVESLPKLDARHLDRLEDLQGRIESALGREADLVQFLVLDRQFHLTTYAGCPTEHLLATVRRLWNATSHYRRAYMLLSGTEGRWMANCEHRLLLDAVRRRDPVDAERYLSGHIRRTRIELSRHPEIFAAAS